MKTLYIATKGGHLTELLRLKKIFKDNDILITDADKKFVSEQINPEIKIKNLSFSPRSKIFKYLISFIKNSISAVKILKSKKINTIITTGSGQVIPYLLVGKIFNKKIIYIETFASVKNMSMTGKILYKLNTDVYIQHEELLNKYPKAIYKGSVY